MNQVREMLRVFALRTGLLLILLGFGAAGCGFDRLIATLPAAVEGFSLEQLEDIQNDERLTEDQKRQAIREAVGAPENESGDRLVEFLLNFNVP